ncbi:Kae1-like domain-containing protein [Rhodoferax antarcticus]|uniref:Kae1-like domain-containing protein n=1 Tax=Rhodoferax antarcticus TaxID=81479 RepID=UPI0022244024|nr:hypothetical protein [Rhodoferax antarcticus]MCW2314132.1 hydrogenase maturation factor HypF (carbamoyltransferase family) [Rhodoferax antarcticus]
MPNPAVNRTRADALCAHTTIAQARTHPLRVVALGGSCLFNRVLTKRIVTQLSNTGLNVLQTQKLLCGDAGLALGQAWVAEQALAVRCGE